MRSIIITCLALMVWAGIATAQDVVAPQTSTVTTSPSTTSLQEILRRQEGLKVDQEDRARVTGEGEEGMPITAPLGTRGGASDPDLWRALRFDVADVSTQQRGPAARTLIQEGGMWWLDFRRGPLLTYGAIFLGGTLAVLAIFYLIRGKVRIEGPITGRRIERFKAIERFAHWLLATSFILLGLTGLFTLFGRKVLIPAFGLEAFSFIATGSKWVHNNISWAFMIALVMIFIFWVLHNLPDRTDINWLLKGGGIFGKGHPPAKKFNAGQKIIFWSVIILGGSISVSGLSLLFPFEFNLFAMTFEKLNAIGAPGWFGFDALETNLSPQEEMQYSQLWHAIISLVLTGIIFAHIYIGTLGMEGAFDAMGSGDVEEQWAREHHSLWVAEVEKRNTLTVEEA
ncbi:formate dehydrogenase gamma subunit [Sulfitobacter brevis]|uniref:Formate dehydrogenase gamma subunit n=1 Tax=Sulfitobacter brevis TaxID=74348 RepID=A0A1I2DW54_9RHOB|nr:formate dehydrogenase subunit gamma [Sulfitobacter brevis]SFE84481.1 formate dehydrogenase gamma subunit [Sulfitobacter brevis]